MALGPQLTALLKRYGLESLTEWASEAIISGMSEDELILSMYEQQAFKTRFAGMFAREAAGLPPISIDDYLAYESTVTSLGSTWGLNLTKQEIDNFIANDVSAREVEQRFTIAATAVYEDGPEIKSELSRLFNIGQEQLMRYWMDPKRELGHLQQQYRMGEIAGASLRTGFGQLTLNQAQRLQEAGVTREAAETGFGQLSNMSELFDTLDEGEDAITIDEQLGVLTGDASSVKKVEQRSQRRQAEFQGSGGFATSQSGFATGDAE